MNILPRLSLQRVQNTSSITKNYMTFILAGRFKNENFMMVDSVVDNNLDLNQEKIYRLINTNTYVSLSGDESFMNLIQLYDDWNYRNNTSYVFDKTHLEKIALELCNIIIKKNDVRNEKTELSNNRIFVVNDDKVEYYDVKITNNKFVSSKCELLPDDSFVLCFRPIELIANFTNSKDFSEQELRTCYQLFNDYKGLFDPNYFKNGFSYYSSLNGYSSFCKDFTQYVTMLYGL